KAASRPPFCRTSASSVMPLESISVQPRVQVHASEKNQTENCWEVDQRNRDGFRTRHFAADKVKAKTCSNQVRCNAGCRHLTPLMLHNKNDRGCDRSKQNSDGRPEQDRPQHTSISFLINHLSVRPK